MVKIEVLVGSTRPNRFSDKPAVYLCAELKKEEGVEAELVDLKDWELPFFNEPVSPIAAKGEYKNPLVKKWAEKISEADGFVIVTPEYNHGYPGVLKNALDWIYFPWNQKPVGFVSHGGAGGSRAIEQLRQVAIALQMHPIQSAVSIPQEIVRGVIQNKNPDQPLSETFRPLREGRMDMVGRFFTELLKLAVVLKAGRSEPASKG